MKKDCIKCKTYWRIAREKKYDHPCSVYNCEGNVCQDFELEFTKEVCMEKFPALTELVLY
jgi:hypothetical protein